MRKLYTGLVIAGLLAGVGCNQPHQTGGGVGTPNTGGGATTFELKGPTGTNKVEHGKSMDYKITVKKGADFKEEIHFSVTVTPADKGVTAKIEPATWGPAGGTDETVTVTANESAAAGDYHVQVLGKPAKGKEGSYTFQVNVPEYKKGK
jgi:hypothetical protein